MNGITAAVLASGNDTRAVEAGAHAYAARSGRYRSLTTWELNKAGNLVGTLELPLAVGIVGGATKTHPVAKAALKIMDVQSAEELASYIAAVGLVENLASLRALSAEGFNLVICVCMRKTWLLWLGLQAILLIVLYSRR